MALSDLIDRRIEIPWREVARGVDFDVDFYVGAMSDIVFAACEEGTETIAYALDDIILEDADEAVREEHRLDDI
jgi:hypothetical protein